MKRLVLAALVLFAGCGDCRSTVHLELDFDATTSAATRLVMRIGDQTYNLVKSEQTTKETLDIKLGGINTGSVVGTVLHVQVDAFVSNNDQPIGSADAMVATGDTSCRLHFISIGAGGSVMSGADMGPTCASGCGSGACAGTCSLMSCQFPTNNSSCTVCTHGATLSGGTCSDGVCGGAGGSGRQQCLEGLCGDRNCGSLKNAANTVAAGRGFTCAVIVGSNFGDPTSVRCWGENVSGVLGVPVIQLGASNVPQLVAGSSGITSLAAGNDFVCGLRGTDVLCWGDNQYGQLGLGNADSSWHPRPTAVGGLPGGANLLAAGGEHACATIKSDIYCWGQNANGELGRLPATTLTPTITIGGVNVPSLALGQHHLCVNDLFSDGTFDVRCYGANNNAQGGVTDGMNHPDGTLVQGLKSEVRLSAGGDTTCAATVASLHTTMPDLRCWGSNSHGQLGGGTNVLSSPMPVATCVGSGTCNNLSDFAVGFDHVCVSVNDGVKCWGNGSNLELGFASPDLNAPGGVALSGPTTFLAAGYDHTCAIVFLNGVVSSVLRCWGNNTPSGQLGVSPIMFPSSKPIGPDWGN